MTDTPETLSPEMEAHWRRAAEQGLVDGHRRVLALFNVLDAKRRRVEALERLVAIIERANPQIVDGARTVLEWEGRDE